MNKRSFRTISILLASALLSFFVIQALWIRNSYIVSSEEVKRAVQEALNETARKIRLRNDIREVRNSFVFSSDSENKSGVHLALSSSRSTHAYASTTVINDSGIVLKGLPSIKIPTGNKTTRISVRDSVIKIDRNGNKTTIITTDSSLGKNTDINIQELMGKMMMEIKSIDVSPLDSMKPDTLKKLIAEQLQQQGIQSSFSFAVSKGGNKKDYLIQSPDFKIQDSSGTYSTPVFPNNVLKSPEKLLVNLNETSSLVFSRMKSLLWISGILALFILSVFILTLRLIQKQKRMSEIRNDFINNMTHELKTPIATISIAADALKNPKVKAEEEKIDYYASVIKEENNKMNRNVERVLQLALTDKHDFSLQYSMTDAHQLILKCLGNFEILFQSKNVTVSKQLNAEKFLIPADAFHLEHAINNLIDNAAKYSGKENPLVKISTENSATQFIFKIEDNGIGMNEDLQKRIFDKFYRAQSGNIHEVKGFGIGLSYAENIIKAHKGTINVQSTEGKGSVFTIELPLSNS